MTTDKIILTMLLVSLSIIIFTIVYYYLESKTILDAFYKSVMIQTLVGVEEPAFTISNKLTMSIQAIIAYGITIGFFAFLFKGIFVKS